MQAGKPKEHTKVVAQPLQEELIWGQVLVSMRAAPINPSDIHAMQTGGTYGEDTIATPFVAGMDGVGVVMKVTSTVWLCTVGL